MCYTQILYLDWHKKAHKQKLSFDLLPYDLLCTSIVHINNKQIQNENINEFSDIYTKANWFEDYEGTLQEPGIKSSACPLSWFDKISYERKILLQVYESNIPPDLEIEDIKDNINN